MVKDSRDSAERFFLDSAAHDGGFSVRFWQDAKRHYQDALDQDPNPSFDKFEVERTVRVPFQTGHVDVLVRIQPDMGEYRALRFTAFTADGGSKPEQIGRWYWYDSDESGNPRQVLAEAVLLDAMNRW